jgi:hypothetical protein
LRSESEKTVSWRPVVQGHDAVVGVVDNAVADYVEPAREKVEALLDPDRRSDELETMRVTFAEEYDRAGRRGSEVRERAQGEVADRLRGAADRIAPVTDRMEPVKQRIEPLVQRVRELV